MTLIDGILFLDCCILVFIGYQLGRLDAEEEEKERRRKERRRLNDNQSFKN